MGLIVWRFFRKSWQVQLAISVLLTSAIVIFALYGAYIERQSILLGVRLSIPLPEGIYLVEVRQPQAGPNPPIPFRGYRSPPVEYLGGWSLTSVSTSLGEVPAAVLDEEAARYLSLPQGSVLLPRALAEARGASVGDSVLLRLGNHAFTAQVAGLHEDPLLGNRMVTEAVGALLPDQSVFIYTPVPGERPEDVARYMSRLYPGETVSTHTRGQALARGIIASSYSPGNRARLELMSFITLAFLSAALFSFLERRRLLAILKAMGLKSREMAGIIAGEGLLAPIIGAVAGSSISAALLWWMNRAGSGIGLSLPIILVSVAGIIPATIIGIAIPARFAQVASVNQLLFERPIPLMMSSVNGLRRRWPSLEPMMAQGVKFIKLDVVQGYFEGFIFRHEGDMVKEGEVLALGNEWWGLRVKEYLAPATGRIVFFNEESGFYGIKPEERQH